MQERAVERDRLARAAVGARRRRSDGRSRSGARGSDACGRSRAGSRATRTPARRTRVRTSYSVRAALPDSRTAIRVRRAVERPIGASITPRGELSAPHAERDVPALDACASRSARTRLSYARGDRADDEQAARVAIEPVHDAGPQLVADRRDLREAREQPVHERAVGVAGARMHDEAGRLGDDDHVVVGVAHVDRDARVADRAARRPRARRAARSRCPPTSRWLFPTGAPVDHDRVARRAAPARRPGSNR